jgi:hypothetical protein
MKTSHSIRNICLAAINRSLRLPFEFRFTTIFETDSMAEIGAVAFFLPSAEEDELPICQVFINNDNWTLVTTNRILTRKEGDLDCIRAKEVKSWDGGDFKGYNKTAYTLGQVQSEKQRGLEIFIETGGASLVIIRTVMTLMKLSA